MSILRRLANQLLPFNPVECSQRRACFNSWLTEALEGSARVPVRLRESVRNYKQLAEKDSLTKACRDARYSLYSAWIQEHRRTLQGQMWACWSWVLDVVAAVKGDQHESRRYANFYGRVHTEFDLAITSIKLRRNVEEFRRCRAKTQQLLDALVYPDEVTLTEAESENCADYFARESESSRAMRESWVQDCRSSDLGQVLMLVSDYLPEIGNAPGNPHAHRIQAQQDFPM